MERFWEDLHFHMSLSEVRVPHPPGVAPIPAVILTVVATRVWLRVVVQVLDPAARLTAGQALKHPWFSESGVPLELHLDEEATAMRVAGEHAFRRHIVRRQLRRLLTVVQVVNLLRKQAYLRRIVQKIIAGTGGTEGLYDKMRVEHSNYNQTMPDARS